VPFSVRGGADALQFLARTARFEDASRPAFGGSAVAETSGQIAETSGLFQVRVT